MTFRPALVIVDYQEDFCPPNGSLAVPCARDILPAVASLYGRRAWTLRVASQDWHPPDHVSFAANHTRAEEAVDCGEASVDESRHPDRRPVPPWTSTVRLPNPLNARESITTQLWPVHCVQHSPGAAWAAEFQQLLARTHTHVVGPPTVDDDNNKPASEHESATAHAACAPDATTVHGPTLHLVRKGMYAGLESYSAFATTPFADPVVPEALLLSDGPARTDLAGQGPASVAHATTSGDAPAEGTTPRQEEVAVQQDVLPSSSDDDDVTSVVRKPPSSAQEEVHGPKLPAFSGSLAALLHGHRVTHVYVVGLAADYCVVATARDAVRQGFVTYMVREATRAVDPIWMARRDRPTADDDYDPLAVKMQGGETRRVQLVSLDSEEVRRVAAV